jgi:hypothetical protein
MSSGRPIDGISPQSPKRRSRCPPVVAMPFRPMLEQSVLYLGRGEQGDVRDSPARRKVDRSTVVTRSHSDRKPPERRWMDRLIRSRDPAAVSVPIFGVCCPHYPSDLDQTTIHRDLILNPPPTTHPRERPIAARSMSGAPLPICSWTRPNLTLLTPRLVGLPRRDR